MGTCSANASPRDCRDVPDLNVPEWIDKEELYGAPSCPDLPDLEPAEEEAYDVVAVKLLCGRADSWSKDVAPRRTSPRAATAGKRRQQKLQELQQPQRRISLAPNNSEERAVLWHGNREVPWGLLSAVLVLLVVVDGQEIAETGRSLLLVVLLFHVPAGVIPGLQLWATCAAVFKSISRLWPSGSSLLWYM